MTIHAEPASPSANSGSGPGPGPARGRRPAGLGRRAWAALVSPKLAIALLVAVLACCVAGVTIVRGERAWALIFSTLWFNGLLVLLAISSGAAFFSRIWTRKASLVSVGMILFHVSFLTLLGGVVFNGLFHFNGVLRLTEGERLPNGDPSSYDSIEMGRFFDVARLRGETSLLEVHTGYKVDGDDKRVAYEIEVGEGAGKRTGIIYTTQNLEHDGVRYLRAKEGYSVGVAVLDAAGEELYAAMVPLQSLPAGPGRHYVTGSAEAPGAFNFPPAPERSLFSLQVSYEPDGGLGREGRVTFLVGPLLPDVGEGAFRTGQVRVGEVFSAGDYRLEAREVRYWVGMSVRSDPGLTIILTSLWAALAGVAMTFVGRIIQDTKRKGRDGGGAAPATNQQEGT